jgi:hypothetical protein
VSCARGESAESAAQGENRVDGAEAGLRAKKTSVAGAWLAMGGRRGLLDVAKMEWSTG